MKLESLLARVLGGGTAIACLAIAIGLVTGRQVSVVAGIAGLIALPLVRVGILVIAFARDRDARLAAAGLAVLAIIGAGIGLGY